MPRASLRAAQRAGTSIAALIAAVSTAPAIAAAPPATPPATRQAAPSGDAALPVNVQNPAAAGTGDPGTAAPLSGEIIVTARRRSESLQKVPAAITAFSGQSLETRSITDLRALSGFVPNVHVEAATTSSSASQVFLRGIGIDSTGFNTDPNVAIYLDDIFVGRLIGSMLGAVDLDRIEVLRGPQGTLYGRNATAGAVKYVTRQPDLMATGGRVAVTAGTFGRRTIRGSANIVLIPEKLAVLVSAQAHDEDGYMKLYDAAGKDTGLRGNARHVQDYRAALKYRPSSQFTAYLTADRTHNRSGLQSTTPTNCAALGTRTGILGSGAIGQISAGQFERCPLYYNDAYASFIGPFAYNDPRYDSAGVAATLTYDLGFATLKSVTGYRGFHDVFSSTLYGKPPPFLNVDLRNDLRQRQFQEEIQLASNGKGPIGYIAGLFYYHEKIKSNYYALIGTSLSANPIINDDLQKADAYAAFGEIYIRPLHGLELTAGARISKDKKTVDRRITFVAPKPAITYQGNLSTSTFTPKLGISYDTGPALLFATYSKGYRAPGWANANPSNLVGAQLQFAKETETSYEAGFKSQWWNRRITLNASAFSATYNNLQATLTANGQTFVVQADARIRGIEVEGSIRPTLGLNVYGNVALLHDEYLVPPPGQPYAQRLKHAPRSNFLIGADYETPAFGVPGNFFVGADANYTGSAFRNVANTIDQQSDAYTLYSARAGYRSEGNRWSVTVGGTNLSNKVYYLLGSQNQARQYQPGRRLFMTGEFRF